MTQPAADSRHTVDNITSDALDALYEQLDAAQQTELARQLATCDKAFASATLRAARAEARAYKAEAERDSARTTIQRLNRRAQAAESENTAYRRAVAQWDVSERGTYIPHASLASIGRAAGTDVLGSVRHLRHFQRVEQAEAALDAVRALADDADRRGITSGHPFTVAAVRAALDAHTNPKDQT
ncbi:MAG: hypothetical protein K0R62_3809 [Nonomuraea muscovyensis]|jgi:chromosome segregation ATPase|nr:hypothetical protein [Nonomuraea muscovyensis]